MDTPTPLPLYTADAFTERPFAGNPAAVCVLPAGLPPDARLDAWMLAVAAEMNLSETAFVAPLLSGDASGDARWSLRWFTPAAEVELCGHATLASAHVLWSAGRVPTTTPIAFETRFRGTLTCRPVGRDIAMDFPAQRCEAATPPAGLLAALRVDPHAVRAVSFGPYDWIVELATADAVAALTPDFAALSVFDCRGVAVTAAGADFVAPDGRPCDFVSRFFAPRLRIAEDPVTGSLHCVLGPYWAARLGRDALDAYQCSRRGGRVGVRVSAERVELRGRAVTVAQGQLLATPA